MLRHLFLRACEVFMSPFNVCTRSHWQPPQINCRPFWPEPVEQWRLSYLNCCPIWGAIKNHLGLYKGAESPFAKFLLVQMGWKSFLKEVRKGSSFHVFYGSECYINIFCLLVGRHLKKMKDRTCSHIFYDLSESQVWEDFSLLPEKCLQADKSLPGQSVLTVGTMSW